MGNGVAVNLSEQGWKIIILDIDQKKGTQAASEIDGDFHRVDVRSWHDQYVAFETTFERYGRVDFGKQALSITRH